MFGDRVQQTTETAGTGSLTLASPVTGFVAFDTKFGHTGTTFYYCVETEDKAHWEIGSTTLSDAVTLVRGGLQTVLESSNAGAAVDFPAGVKTVFNTIPAIAADRLDAPDNSLAFAIALG